MDLKQLQDLFFWCMVVNSGVYFLTAISVVVMRDFVCKINAKIFGLDEATVRKSIQTYLASYKLLITFFNFAPWIAILIIK